MTEDKLPKGYEFEDFIAAHLQGADYFVERNLSMRTEQPILELDVIATKYDTGRPTPLLFEAKSGEWEYKDIFKVRGWMDLLEIERGVFAVHLKKSHFDVWHPIAKELDIDLIAIEEFGSASSVLSTVIKSEPVDEIDVKAWRNSFRLERTMLNDLRANKKKNLPNAQRYRELVKYYLIVTDGIFFTKKVDLKLRKLYQAFKQNPHLSAKCAHEINGGHFVDDIVRIPERIHSLTYYDCKYTDIQISAYVEHRARLAILKNAVDYVLHEQAVNVESAEDVVKKLARSSSGLNYLPKTFLNGLEAISRDSHFHKYPIFWQWFLWVFGGFILKDYEEEEYALLARKTGVPVEEIPNALKAYDWLFPIKGDWLKEKNLPNHNLKLMTMFSVPFQGIGADYRRDRYCTDGELRSLKVAGDHTIDELAKWDRLAHSVLSSAQETG